MRRLLLILLLGFWAATYTAAQHDNHGHDDHKEQHDDHSDHNHDDHDHDTHSDSHDSHADHGHSSCEVCVKDHEKKESTYDPVGIVMDHIGNSNEFHIFGSISLPLPCILYSSEAGVDFFMSSKFHHGHQAYNRYVSDHGVAKRIIDPSFPMGEVAVDCVIRKNELVDGKMKEVAYVLYKCKELKLDNASTLDGGMLGGGLTSFYDFSISKNVFGMLLAALIMILIFTRIAKRYKEREGKSPKGIQSLIEPVFIFIRDNVAKPMIGPKYNKYMPLIMTIFFFILVCNLMGLIPFFPGSTNITGNLGVTMALALIAFFVTTFSGNKHYWEHVFWMPGIPAWVKIFILTPVEFLGLFIKPFSLMIRLFANITAGHIIILSLVGLIFVFGNNGASTGGAVGGMAVAIPFTLFMNIIELIVAFIQAFIFAILTASYIGAAVEEHHDHDHGVEGAH